MALTRKFLSALGIEAEKVDEIISAHADTVDGLKEQLKQYKEDAEKLPNVQKELDELKAAADKGDKNPYKVKYEAIKEEFDNYKADAEAKETKGKKEAAYRTLLKEAGVLEKRIDSIIRVTDLEKEKLDADGKFENAAELTKSIKEEWSDFIVTSSQKGADTPNPPQGGGKAYKSKDEIYAIKDAAERQKAIAENHELFGF